MTLKKRLVTASILGCLALCAFSVARHYSVPLISYVVEEALIQKLPAGMDSGKVRSRFQASISELPDRQAKLERLLGMSQYLEKLQTVEYQDLERLLARRVVDVPRKQN